MSWRLMLKKGSRILNRTFRLIFCRSSATRSETGINAGTGLSREVAGRNSDAVVDAILSYVLNNAEIREKYDPLRIDSVPFDGGSANNNKIYDILKLARSGPATITAEDGASFVIDATLEVNEVTGDGSYTCSGYWLCSEGTFAAKVDYITSNLRIAVSNGQATLEYFSVSMSDVIVTEFTGATIFFNAIVKSIINKTLRENREMVRSVVENSVEGAFAEEIRKIDFSPFIIKAPSKL